MPILRAGLFGQHGDEAIRLDSAAERVNFS